MLKAIIIDDEKWARNIIINFGEWRKHDIEVVGEAEDGEQGLELIKKHNPDIILMDMEMTNMDGVGFLREIEKVDNMLKVIVISGHDDFEYMKQAIQSKVIEYLLKPIQPNELNIALKECVEQLIRSMDTATLVSKGLYKGERIKEVIDFIKEFRLSLRGININSILKDFDKIKAIKEDRVLNPLIHIKFLNEYIRPVIKEELYYELKNCKEVMELFKKYEDNISNNVKLEEYFEITTSIIKKEIDFRVSEMKKDHISIALVAKNYADSMYNDDVSLSVIAKRLYVSKEYLCASFKKKYGITLGNYILDLKMKEALKLLKLGVPHKEIAFSLGYKNLSYFYRVFRKYYKCTPKEFATIS